MLNSYNVNQIMYSLFCPYLLPNLIEFIFLYDEVIVH